MLIDSRNILLYILMILSDHPKQHKALDLSMAKFIFNYIFVRQEREKRGNFFQSITGHPIKRKIKQRRGNTHALIADILNVSFIKY